MSLMRRVSFLCGAAVLVAGFAGAQSSPSLNPFTSNPSSSSLFAAGESSSNPSQTSSNPFQLASGDAVSGDSALPASSAAGGSGAGHGGQESRRFYSPSHLALNFGAGFNAPIGNDGPYISWGGNFNVGGGLHFSKRLSLLAEYQLLDNKLPGSFIAASGSGATGGNAHIWGLTLDPVIDLFPARTSSFYVTGGGGFYRKVTSFTVQVCCDFYGNYVNEVAAHFSSNQGGLNFGAGFTHRLGGTYSDGNMKLFAEARYLWVNTPEYNAFTGSTKMGATELLPVSFGVRW
jgi:hypothetical protein